MANLNDPEVNPINELRLKPLLQEAVKIQRDFDGLHLGTGFNTVFQTRLSKFNEDIQREFNDAIADEERSKRETSDGSKRYRSSLCASKVGKLASENRDCNDKIATLQEDLIALERFLPGENSHLGQNARFESTQLEVENEILQMRILVAKEKLQTENERLGQIQGMLKRMPLELEKQQTTLEAAKRDRKGIDETLENTHAIRANLLSEQEFLLDKKKVLEKRILDGKTEINKMKVERKKQKLILKKQELMIALSEEMAALRKMNLQRVAGKVQTLLKINSEIDEFQSS
jgi:hypothetical protein